MHLTKWSLISPLWFNMPGVIWRPSNLLANWKCFFCKKKHQTRQSPRPCRFVDFMTFLTISLSSLCNPSSNVWGFSFLVNSFACLQAARLPYCMCDIGVTHWNFLFNGVCVLQFILTTSWLWRSLSHVSFPSFKQKPTWKYLFPLYLLTLEMRPCVWFWWDKYRFKVFGRLRDSLLW